MIYQEGYVYHIKDEYFEKVQDGNLMQNKENGTYRPTFYCLRDEKTSLLWMVPLSSRVQKYKAIHDKQEQKYGRFLTIVLGEFDGKEAAFLLQNMFPVRDYYLDHIHTRNNFIMKQVRAYAQRSGYEAWDAISRYIYYWI